MARAGAFGASSVRFELPLSLLSPERAREASGIVYRSTDEGCLEEQLHRTRGCGTFCSHLRLGVRARPARGRLIKSHWAVTTAPLARCLQVPRARYLQHPPQDMLPEALLAAAAAAVSPPLSVPVPARSLVPQALCRHLHPWATCLRPDVLGHHFRADVSLPA